MQAKQQSKRRTRWAPPGPLTVEEVGKEELDLIGRLNETIFNEQRIINTFDRRSLIMLLARWDGQPAGFKIGYQIRSTVYYSAKGGVLPSFRRRGVARALLYALMDRARELGYQSFIYDTFPNKHPGMTILGLNEGFRVMRAGFNAQYDDYRLRLQMDL